MNDVTTKRVSLRRAVAQGRLNCDATTLAALRAGSLPKGEPFGIAEAAGLLAAKQTGHLIPHCHPVQIDHLRLKFSVDNAGVLIAADAACVDRTGIEMEALTAVAVAALTLYDLCKPLKGMLAITDLRLLEKTGGRTQEKAEHAAHAGRAAVLTISDSRSARRADQDDAPQSDASASDASGDHIAERLAGYGVTVSVRATVSDDIAAIRARVESWLADSALDYIFTTGGTGAGPRDVTVAALQPLLEKELPGIAEAMRTYGQRRVQAAMFSASLAGVARGHLVVALPGSLSGVRESLAAILPALLHGPHIIAGGGHGESG